MGSNFKLFGSNFLTNFLSDLKFKLLEGLVEKLVPRKNQDQPLTTHPPISNFPVSMDPPITQTNVWHTNQDRIKDVELYTHF